MRFLSKVVARGAVKWVTPTWSDEKDEFERYKNVFSENEWKNIFEHSSRQTQPLEDLVWRQLKNTDSYEVSSLEEAKKLAKRYGKDIDSIVSAFKSGSELPAPIVVRWEDGTYELIAGNTRLMVARATHTTPQVVLLDLEEV
jgi:hypothetical protein